MDSYAENVFYVLLLILALISLCTLHSWLIAASKVVRSLARFLMAVL